MYGFFLAVIFLMLYYAVWIRYFVGGRKIALLNRTFLFVPMSLAVFLVLYFLCVAGWLHNLPTVIIMVVLGGGTYDGVDTIFSMIIKNFP